MHALLPRWPPMILSGGTQTSLSNNIPNSAFKTVTSSSNGPLPPIASLKDFPPTRMPTIATTTGATSSLGPYSHLSLAAPHQDPSIHVQAISAAAKAEASCLAAAAAASAASHPAFPSVPLWSSHPYGSLGLIGSERTNYNHSNFLGDPMAKTALLDIARMGHYPYGKKLFGCPQCRYLTDRKNNLKRHVATMHQDCDKTLECCGVVFKNKASLRDHVLIFHSNGYMCRYCGRNFCRKALLKRHLTVHSGQKDYVCSQCDYATSHKSNLERHKKVHERRDDDQDLTTSSKNSEVERTVSSSATSTTNSTLADHVKRRSSFEDMQQVRSTFNDDTADDNDTTDDSIDEIADLDDANFSTELTNVHVDVERLDGESNSAFTNVVNFAN